MVAIGPAPSTQTPTPQNLDIKQRETTTPSGVWCANWPL